MSREWEDLTYNERLLVGVVLGSIAGMTVGVLFLIGALIWMYA